MSEAARNFKEALKKYESEIGLGPFESIKATVEDVYPRHDDGMYTQSVIWIRYEGKWIVMFYGPNKYGEVYSSISISEEEPDFIENDECPAITEILEELEITIEHLADEIYWVNKVRIDRVFDLDNVLDADIDLLEDTLERLKAAKVED